MAQQWTRTERLQGFQAVARAREDLRVPTRVKVWSLALAAGCAVASVSLLVQWLVYVYWLGNEGMRVIGAIIAGTVTALLTERILEASRKRRQSTARRFEVIAEMNHHIRNSLQTLSYQRFAIDEQNSQRLKEAVDRIQWVLEEVLPAVQDDERLDQPGRRQA